MFGELVTAYLFLAGVGAGGVAAASLADLLLVREPFGVDVVPDFAEKCPAERLVAGVLALSCGALALGAGCLAADLGRIDRVLSLFLAPPATLMNLGAWAVALLTVLAAALALVRFMYLPWADRRAVVVAEVVACGLAVVVAVYAGLLLQTLAGAGGVMGKRPDYAVTVYCNLIRRTYRRKPIIIGGIEASLRRLAHYDYWSDKLKRSILLDSQADLLIYGMGERAVVEIANALNDGMDAQDITYIDGTVYKTREPDTSVPSITLPAFPDMQKNPRVYAESFSVQYRNTDPFCAKRLIEPYGDHEFIVQNPPQKPLSQKEMDHVYDLPYCRTFHPSYKKLGGIPAIAEIEFSLTSCRGCFGACSFCALTFHQGRIIQTRSQESIIKEAEGMTHSPGFKGYIHDVGGPTANFRQPACKKQLQRGACPTRQCLFPAPCKNLIADHTDYLSLLRKLRKLPGVKKVFIRSGIRFDYLLADPSDTFFKELVRYHISGQLKVAPEHVSDQVLRVMGKPPHAVYQQFVEKYKRINEQEGMKQYVVPYLMSSHPGCTMEEAVKLAEYLRDTNHEPEQVQDFYPTPSTLSTVMYYTGLDPRTMEPVYVPKNPHEKAMQRALMQYRRAQNYFLVREALQKAGRTDLIGFTPKCLIRPYPPKEKKPGTAEQIPERKSASAKPAKKRPPRR